MPHFLLAAAGVWLMAAPAVLGYGDPAATSDRIAGPALAAIGFLAGFQITRGLRWLNLGTGAWLVVAPWLLGFPAAATVNSVVIGVAALVLAPWGKPDQRRYGGGWVALWRPGATSADDLPARDG
ncbi:SPW repeat-containing protein [Amycolatopsis arida]|uniref:SPW repeat-containing protein n=1 Tax=Amycolatopsis arida TaxID=587909 RepID=A0A1I6AS38_9PSEU|nr:SPW repeat protein [Amycolatopsis arida]TDX97579.1 SPW repeat-containing protein [Amycolatopsis arida]SFQ71377.1 SPW repeat-containing protein [Amycolatopsis arida]